jgi:hypothetical protein
MTNDLKQRRFLDDTRTAKRGQFGADGCRIKICAASAPPEIRNCGGTSYLRPMRIAYELCLATTGRQVPSGPDWIHEVKRDG